MALDEALLRGPPARRRARRRSGSTPGSRRPISLGYGQRARRARRRGALPARSASAWCAGPPAAARSSTRVRSASSPTAWRRGDGRFPGRRRLLATYRWIGAGAGAGLRALGAPAAMVAVQPSDPAQHARLLLRAHRLLRARGRAAASWWAARSAGRAAAFLQHGAVMLGADPARLRARLPAPRTIRSAGMTTLEAVAGPAPVVRRRSHSARRRVPRPRTGSSSAPAASRAEEIALAEHARRATSTAPTAWTRAGRLPARSAGLTRDRGRRASIPDAPRVAVGAVVLDGDRVLLVQRGQAPSLGKWSLPGGLVAPRRAARGRGRREVIEECGLHVRVLGLCGVIDRVDPRAMPTGARPLPLGARGLSRDRRAGGAVCAGSDAADARWVPVDEVAQLRHHRRPGRHDPPRRRDSRDERKERQPMRVSRRSRKPLRGARRRAGRWDATATRRGPAPSWPRWTPGSADGSRDRARRASGSRAKPGQVSYLHTGGTAPAPRVIVVGLGRQAWRRRGGRCAARRGRRCARRARPRRAPPWPCICAARGSRRVRGPRPRSRARCSAPTASTSTKEKSAKVLDRPDRAGAGCPPGARPPARARALGEIGADATTLARDLVNEPANVVTPTSLAEHAREIARAGRLRVRVLDRDECAKLGMGAFLGVAQGSQEPPQFIHLTYAPRRRAPAQGGDHRQGHHVRLRRPRSQDRRRACCA